ncbi:MAG: family 10 glycosylhydrolase [Clostridia bacterium]|nr:family 10 glycosylhydrolase [Clostridia bacterium]
MKKMVLTLVCALLMAVSSGCTKTPALPTDATTVKTSATTTHFFTQPTVSTTQDDTTATTTTTTTTYPTLSGTVTSSIVTSTTATTITTAKPTATTKPTTTQTTTKKPVKKLDIKGVWYSFLELEATGACDEATFTATINERFANIKNKGYNAVFVHVRCHGDATYPSEYYPWAECVSGTAGVAPAYDPLQIMVNAAKSQGLKIHGWINPYRTMTDEQFETVADTYLTKQWYASENRSDYMIKHEDNWWLKPSNPQVLELIKNGAKELFDKYQLDGIHIDDYFYAKDPSYYGDSVASAKQNTTKLVKALYDIAHSSGAVFGISPAGRFVDTLPDSDLRYYSTDFNTWCKKSGYLDYVAPQIYWSRNASNVNTRFETVLKKWSSFVTAPSVELYVGLAPYKEEMDINEINAQIQLIKAYEKSSGFIMFRYDFIWDKEYNFN